MVRTVSLWPVPSLIVSSKTNLFRWLIVVSTTRPAPSLISGQRSMAMTVAARSRGRPISTRSSGSGTVRADANVVLLDPLGRLERFDVDVVARAVGPVRLGEQDKLFPRLRVDRRRGLPSAPLAPASCVTMCWPTQIVSMLLLACRLEATAVRPPRAEADPKFAPPTNSAASDRQPASHQRPRWRGLALTAPAVRLSSRQRLGWPTA